MFFRLLLESFLRQRRRKFLAGIAIFLGSTTITAMLALATTIGDRIHQELSIYGANIVIYPKASLLDVKIGDVDVKPATGGAYLHEADLEKLKTIFWANNIQGVSPERHETGVMLSKQATTGDSSSPRAIWNPGVVSLTDPTAVPVTAVGYWFHHKFGALTTGATQLHPWWKLQGRWPVASNALHNEIPQEVVIGAALAKRFELHSGDWISIGTMSKGRVVGIVSTGDTTDQQILYSLDAGNEFLASDHGTSQGKELDRVEISATTKPEDAFARMDPDKLSAAKREIWYCRPYANSIAYQIREAIPGADAQQIRRVEQSEGTLLERISGLMWIISIAALLAAGFAVSAAMATAVLERRHEIGLMRSLGASKTGIALLFYAEASVLALIFGMLGYFLGSALAAWLGVHIFIDQIVATSHMFNPVLFPIVVAIAWIVSIGGSTPSIQSALNLDPSSVLRADG